MAIETNIVTLYQGLEEQKRVPISPRTHAKAVTDLIDTIYPVGSIYMSVNNANPSALFGGTWTLVDKGFKNQYLDSDLFTVVNTSSCTTSAIFEGNNIRIKVSLTSSVGLGSSKQNLINLNLSKLGLTGLHDGVYLVGGCYAGGTIYFGILETDGKLYVRDVIRNGGTTVSSGAGVIFDFVLVNRMEYMLDSFCDKFYWKRTA